MSTVTPAGFADTKEVISSDAKAMFAVPGSSQCSRYYVQRLASIVSQENAAEVAEPEFLGMERHAGDRGVGVGVGVGGGGVPQLGQRPDTRASCARFQARPSAVAEGIERPNADPELKNRGAPAGGTRCSRRRRAPGRCSAASPTASPSEPSSPSVHRAAMASTELPVVK
ncbi:hypothetical protein ACP4OV_025770 [Aristida adscensionis]